MGSASLRLHVARAGLDRRRTGSHARVAPRAPPGTTTNGGAERRWAAHAHWAARKGASCPARTTRPPFLYEVVCAVPWLLMCVRLTVSAALEVQQRLDGLFPPPAYLARDVLVVQRDERDARTGRRAYLAQ